MDEAYVGVLREELGKQRVTSGDAIRLVAALYELAKERSFRVREFDEWDVIESYMTLGSYITSDEAEKVVLRAMATLCNGTRFSIQRDFVEDEETPEGDETWTWHIGGELWSMLLEVRLRESSVQDVSIRPGMVVRVHVYDSDGSHVYDGDGSFEVHYDTAEYPECLIVRESSGIPGSVLGGANEVFYCEYFGKDSLEKVVKRIKGES